MTRVLMISKALVVGIYQRKLEHIAESGVDLRVVVPPYWRDERGKLPLERAYTDGYRLDVLPARLNGRFHLYFYAGLRRIMREFKPEIVHIDEEPYNVAAWQCLYHARRVKARTVFFSWQNINRAYPFPFGAGESWFLRHVNHGIVGTDSAAQVWREKGYTGELTTIPQFGTDTDLFKPPQEVHQRRERFVIGYVGRLVAEKGVDVLLRAVAGMSGDWELRILGGGPARDDLKGLAEALGIGSRVKFLPQIPSTQIHTFYHDLSALALPSLTRPNWKEQFGRVLVEAMASGVPVVGSDSGAIPEVIGDAGLVTPEGDAEALRGALMSVQNDFTLAAHLSMLGQERAAAHFTHRQIAAQTVAVYSALMAQ